MRVKGTCAAGLPLSALLLLGIFVVSSFAGVGGFSYTDGQQGIDDFSAMLTQQIRQQTGFDALVAAYPEYAYSQDAVQFSTALSEFGVELSELTNNYLNALTYISNYLSDQYDINIEAGTSNMSWPASFSLTDMTNTSTPTTETLFLLDCDYQDLEARTDFLNKAQPLALMQAWQQFWTSTNEYSTALTSSLGNAGQLGLRSIFFGGESFTLSLEGEGTVYHPANEAWQPYEPQFRPWFVNTATLRKLVVLALVYPIERPSVWEKQIVPAAVSILNMLGASDYVNIVIDHARVRYYPTSTGMRSLTRAKPEVVLEVIEWLTNWTVNCGSSCNSTKQSTFNVTFAMHSSFAKVCPTSSSLITIIYMDSTVSGHIIPSGSKVKALWDSAPINNRVIVMYFVQEGEGKKENAKHLSLINLACQSSGVYLPVNKRHPIKDRLFDMIQFLYGQLSPFSPAITLGLGWRESQTALTWSMTLPVFSSIQDKNSDDDNQVLKQTLVGVIGFDVGIDVFANVLFRGRRFESYVFVTTLDLDVLLHVGMDAFNFIDETTDASSQHVGLPYSKSIVDYETANTQIQLSRYASAENIAELETRISNNTRSRVFFADCGRGYNWINFQFFDLLLVSTYILPNASFTPSFYRESFMPIGRTGTTCNNDAAISDSFQFAVPCWSQDSAAAIFAATRLVPDGDPLQIHQYRNVNQTSDGLPQRTWNISGTQYLASAFSTASLSGEQLTELATISQYMMVGEEEQVLAIDIYGLSRTLFDNINSFLQCDDQSTAGLTAAAIASTQITAGLPTVWSDMWLNPPTASWPGQPLPFTYIAATQSIFRFWPANDAVSLATSVFIDLDSSLQVEGQPAVRTYYIRAGGAATTEVRFLIHALPAADATLTAPPSAYVMALFEYDAFRSFVFSDILGFCADPVRCYIVDSSLSVILSSADIQWDACQYQFEGVVDIDSLITIEPTLTAAMQDAGLIAQDGTSLTSFRINSTGISSSSFDFGSTDCPSGTGYIWSTGSAGFFLIAVDNSNIPTSDLCAEQYADCPGPVVDSNATTTANTDLMAYYSPSISILSCPSSDISQQVIEALRPAGIKCYDPAHPNIQLLSFTDIISIILYGTYTIFAIIVLMLFSLFLKHRHSSVIESSNPIFVFATLTGTLLALVSVFFWLGVPNDAICIARMWFAICTFALLTGMVFAKILYVYLNIKDPKVLRIKMPDRLLIAYAAMPIVPQVLVVIIWTAYDPLTAKLTLDPIDYGTLEQQTAQWVCNSDTSLGFYLTAYIIQGILLAAGAILTLTTRKTKSLWNESSWIGLCVYVSAIVYPTVILLRTLLDATPQQEFLILFVGVFIVVAVFIAFVFCTKAYIILFSPELNSTEARLANEINTNFQPPEE